MGSLFSKNDPNDPWVRVTIRERIDWERCFIYQKWKKCSEVTENDNLHIRYQRGRSNSYFQHEQEKNETIENLKIYSNWLDKYKDSPVEGNYVIK